MRFLLPLLLSLALAGCAGITYRPAPAAPSTTPPAIFLADDALNWRLTAEEIEYIQLFRFSHARWTPSATDELAGIVAQYRAAPDVLAANGWRAQAVKAAARLRNAYLWFSPDSPSQRFQPVADEIAAALAIFDDAGALLARALDEDDGDLLEDAQRRAGEGWALLQAIDALFEGFFVAAD